MNKVHYSSKSNEWSTPQKLFDILNKEFDFTLDPCATHENKKCLKYFTIEDDGLVQAWNKEIVFMNPPYGREIGNWIEKAYFEKTSTVVCLIPARTDTKYFHNLCMLSDEIRFIRGRLYFSEGMGPAPFPSCLIVFRAGRQREVPYPIISTMEFSK